MSDTNLKLLGVDIHLEQGVTEDMSKAAGVEITVRPAIVLVVVDLRKLEATILQKLIIMEFLVGHVNLEGPRRKSGFYSDQCNFYTLIENPAQLMHTNKPNSLYTVSPA